MRSAVARPVAGDGRLAERRAQPPSAPLRAARTRGGAIARPALIRTLLANESARGGARPERAKGVVGVLLVPFRVGVLRGHRHPCRGGRPPRRLRLRRLLLTAARAPLRGGGVQDHRGHLGLVLLDEVHRLLGRFAVTHDLPKPGG
eukprot:1182834-Prorocentrum_minimum.AAC.1